MNDLQNKLIIALFGSAGPVAKGLSLWFGWDAPTVDIVCNILMLVTPSIAGGVMVMATRIENRIAQIKALAPADQAKVAAALPLATVVNAAAASPDVSVIGVSERTNDPKLLQAMTDPAQPAIVPASSVEVK